MRAAHTVCIHPTEQEFCQWLSVCMCHGRGVVGGGGWVAPVYWFCVPAFTARLRGLVMQRLVVQRSVHSSVVDALVLAGLRASFVHPSVDDHLGISHGVTAQDLSEALDACPDAAAAHLITPSYFGAVSDISIRFQGLRDAIRD